MRYLFPASGGGCLPGEHWPEQTPLPPISISLSLSPLSSMHTRLFLPPSAPLFLVSWRRGGSRCEGRLGQERGWEKETEREIEIHIPLLTEVIVQDLLDKPLDAYTQTIMRNKQWSPSRQLGPIVFYVHRCVCVCAHLATEKINEQHRA